MELCLAAGRLDVGEVARTLPAEQFRLWELYHEIKPIGQLRLDYHAAQIAMMVHNAAVKQEHQKPLSDFLLTFQDQEDIERKKQEEYEKLPILNGVRITEQMWIAMCMTAMNDAGGFDPAKVQEIN